MTASRETKSIVEILQRVSMELQAAAMMVEDLHRVVEAVDEGRTVRSACFIRSAQSIDIIQQRLGGLAHFVDELAALLPSHWVVDSRNASRKLRLAQLAARLSHNDEAAEALQSHPVGEMEMF